MNIEIAPKEYWKELTVNKVKLYCFLLNINGKTGWRLPTKEEYEQTNAIPGTAMYQSEFDNMTETDYHFKSLFRLSIVPVRTTSNLDILL